MSSMRSVIITLPKGMQKSTIVGGDFNFSTLLNQKQQQLKNLEVKMEDNIDDSDCTEFDDVKQDGWTRGKKRRLDHLTWEEKLQRKKLKNRVAAQTSRDRKKAKLDELEDTVRALKESNDLLTKECSQLRSQNEALTAESIKLRKDCEENKKNIENNYCKNCHNNNVNCNVSTLGSAAGWYNTIGINNDDTKCKYTNQDTNGLLNFDEIFENLQSTNIEELDEFTEDLLRQVTAQAQPDLHTFTQQMSIGENIIEKSDNSERMVGTSSKNVETSGNSDCINEFNNLSSTSDIIDIKNDKLEFKNLLNTAEGSFDYQVKNNDNDKLISSGVKNENIDTVFGTYDEATNCITIMCAGDDDDDDVVLNEKVQDVVTENLKNFNCDNDNINNSPYTFSDSLSPSSTHSEDSDLFNFANNNNNCDSSLSDYGYESHDSFNIDNLTREKLIDIPYELFPDLA